MNLMVLIISFSSILLVKGQMIFGSAPSELKINRIFKCPYKQLLISHVAWKKLSRSITAYEGNFTLPFDVDEAGGQHMTVHLSISRWSDGGWKHNVIDVRFERVCHFLDMVRKDEMKVFPKLFYMLKHDVWYKLRPPLELQCPLHKGTYGAKDVSLNLNRTLFTAIGRFLWTFELLQKNTTLFCYLIDLQMNRNLGQY